MSPDCETTSISTLSSSQELDPLDMNQPIAIFPLTGLSSTHSTALGVALALPCERDALLASPGVDLQTSESCSWYERGAWKKPDQPMNMVEFEAYGPLLEATSESDAPALEAYRPYLRRHHWETVWEMMRNGKYGFPVREMRLRGFSGKEYLVYDGELVVTPGAEEAETRQFGFSTAQRAAPQGGGERSDAPGRSPQHQQKTPGTRQAAAASAGEPFGPRFEILGVSLAAPSSSATLDYDKLRDSESGLSNEAWPGEDSTASPRPSHRPLNPPATPMTHCSQRSTDRFHHRDYEQK